MSPDDRQSSQFKQDAVAKDWRARGFSCGLWVDPPGQVWADFVHDTDELVMVVEGDVEFEVDGETHRPAAGEELLIPAGAGSDRKEIFAWWRSPATRSRNLAMIARI